MRGKLSRRRLFPLLAAAIASVAHASTLDELLVESARCDALASGQEDGEVCAPEHHTDILIELGDAHLELEEWKEATEAYQTAGMVSFEHFGVDSREHGAALLRLATAQLLGLTRHGVRREQPEARRPDLDGRQRRGREHVGADGGAASDSVCALPPSTLMDRVSDSSAALLAP